MKKYFSNGTLRLPPVERLRELFDYSPITGCLYHKATGCGKKVGDVVGPVPNSTGYLHCMVDYVLYQQARVIWKMVTGKDPGLLDVEHIDESKTNNKWTNLRLATRSQNVNNMKKRSGCSSRFKGVTRYKDTDKWIAALHGKGTRKYLGIFDTEEEAHQAWCEAARDLHGDFFNDGTGSCLCA